MFRSQVIRFAHRISDVVDEMLVGDFEYCEGPEGLYADVDYDRVLAYHREHPHRFSLTARTERRPGKLPHQWEKASRLTAATFDWPESAGS